MCVQFTMGHDALYERNCRVRVPAFSASGESRKENNDCRTELVHMRRGGEEDRISCGRVGTVHETRFFDENWVRNL